MLTFKVYKNRKYKIFSLITTVVSGKFLLNILFRFQPIKVICSVRRLRASNPPEVIS